MKARKKISEIEAVEAVIELAMLNYDIPVEFIVCWKRFEMQVPEDHSWVADPFPAAVEGADGLNRAHLLHLTNNEEQFLTGKYERVAEANEYRYGFRYTGQFTNGRCIEVYRTWNIEDGWEHWIEAETGTDKPSTYFWKFQCLSEHLPELIKAIE